jgi:hypothetical protein
LKIRIFTRTSIPRLRQNDHERAVGIVQAGMTHQAATDHFDVSRITISRLKVRLRQTCRTNDRPRNGRRGERFTDQRVYESDRFGGGIVMVWAGTCHDGRTQLKIVQGTLNAVKYRDNILDPIVLHFLQQRNLDHVFQPNNARCHVAHACQNFLNQNHIRNLPWPSKSTGNTMRRTCEAVVAARGGHTRY